MHSFLNGIFLKASPKITNIFLKLLPIFSVVRGIKLLSSRVYFEFMNKAGVRAKIVQAMPIITANCLVALSGLSNKSGL